MLGSVVMRLRRPHPGNTCFVPGSGCHLCHPPRRTHSYSNPASLAQGRRLPEPRPPQPGTGQQDSRVVSEALKSAQPVGTEDSTSQMGWLEALLRRVSSIRESHVGVASKPLRAEGAKDLWLSRFSLPRAPGTPTSLCL